MRSFARYDHCRGGDLGDAYEGLGALFSGLAFIGVLYALKYQIDELEDQRKAIVQQQTEMEAQSFETLFFQLLKFQRESMQTLTSTVNAGYP
jgi:hypothetical protein